MKIYTGIGSRDTPDDVLTTMRTFGLLFANKGYTLRSGHAPGADMAFEEGCDMARGSKEIYLPWPKFNGADGSGKGYCVPFFTPELVSFAGTYHPNWSACSMSNKKLLSRNACQVLGLLLNRPTEFVVCWTPGGLAGGGTGQAIRIAQAHDIPVFDLGRENGEQDLVDYLNRQETHG